MVESTYLKLAKELFGLAFERASAVRVARVEKCDPGVDGGVVGGLQLSVVGFVVAPQQLTHHPKSTPKERGRVAWASAGWEGGYVPVPFHLKEASLGLTN